MGGSSFGNNRLLNEVTSVQNSTSLTQVNIRDPNFGSVHLKSVQTIQRTRKAAKSVKSATITPKKERLLRRSYSSFQGNSALRQSMAKIYNQDSHYVPSYYNRPGPGLYHDFTAGFGQITQVSKFKNSPSGYIQQPRDWQAVKERLQRSASRESMRKTTGKSIDRSASGERLCVSVERKPDISWTRFYNYTEELRTQKLKVLYPNTSMVRVNQNRQPFSKFIGKGPFPVKPEHATTCQHQIEPQEKEGIPGGTVPKNRRDFDSPVRHLLANPGPSNYETIPAKSGVNGTDRPLSSHKTFGLGRTFGNDPRTLNHTRQYSKEWSRKDKNKLGPGPAAYAGVYDQGSAAVAGRG